MRLKSIPFYFFLFSLFCSPAFALYEQDDEELPGYFQLRLGGGATWVDPEDGHLSFITDRGTETDTITFDTSLAGIVTAGVGYVFPLCDYCDSSKDAAIWFHPLTVSVDATYQIQTDFNGDIYLLGDPALGNEQNQSDIQNLTALLNLTLNVVQYHRTYLFAMGGIGPGWTWVEYKDTPKADAPADSGVSLEDQATTTFVWQAGAGIGYSVIEDSLDMTLTYLYTDLGDVSTSSTLSDSSSSDATVIPAKFNLSQQSVMLGFNWRLN